MFNKMKFGAVHVILSILIIGFALGFVMHTIAPEGSGCCAQHECGQGCEDGDTDAAE
jgi:hypothetical protein